MTNTIPRTMQAVVLHSYDQGFDGITIEERPVPQPKTGEVLVKVAASPINPSDLMFIKGRYGYKKRLPIVPGFEFTGTVVAAGSGILPRLWMGRRIASGVQSDGDGPWAEYITVPVRFSYPIRQSTPDDLAAMMLVNPLTAWVIIDIAKQKRQRVIVQTAAGSALGRMIWRLARRSGMDVINVVRRVEQAAELRQMGMQYVLCSSDPTFDEQLKALCRDLNCTLAFDAVSGELAGRILQALPRGGCVTVYGGLSEQDPVISTGQLIFREKTLNGLWLSDWVRRANIFKLLITMYQVEKIVTAELQSDVRARYKLPQIHQALATYSDNMSGGKVLITP